MILCDNAVMQTPSNNRDEARDYIGHYLNMVAHALCVRNSPDNWREKSYARRLEIYPVGNDVADVSDLAILAIAGEKALNSAAARVIFGAMLVKEARGRAAWPEAELPEKVFVPIRRGASCMKLATTAIETAAIAIIAKNIERFAAFDPAHLQTMQRAIDPQP